jgi:NADPH:quinone reductase-like Zn-dependent oxidoreductase
VRTLAALLAEGRFHPLIDRRYPLTDVREAFAHVASGRKVGHVLLDVAPVP